MLPKIRHVASEAGWRNSTLEQWFAYDAAMDGRRNSETTLKDVARVAGVHYGTVSRALDPARSHLVNAETRELIQAVAQRLGYRVNSVARSLRKGSAGLIGVVVTDVSNPFQGPFLRGLESVIGRVDGRLLLIAESHDDSTVLEAVLEELVGRRLDAIILTAARRGDEAIVRRASRAVPVVLAIRSLSTTEFPMLTHDDELGGRLATEHLVALGHERLAQLRGSDDVSSFRGRAAGYHAVLARTSARDVSMDRIAAEPSVAEGHRLALALLDQPEELRPTAIFAHNDLLAVGVLDAIAERGLRCPGDISVVGYNDAPLTDHIDPPLTTVHLPARELGERAGRLVASILAGEVARRDEEPLPPELVVRASTAPPLVT